MIQRFIELGEGTSDLYELLAIARSQKERVLRLLALQTKIKDKDEEGTRSECSGQEMQTIDVDGSGECKLLLVNKIQPELERKSSR